MVGRFCMIMPPAIRASLLLLLALVPLAGCRRRQADGVALVGAAVFDGVAPYLKRDMVIVVRKAVRRVKVARAKKAVKKVVAKVKVRRAVKKAVRRAKRAVRSRR